MTAEMLHLSPAGPALGVTPALGGGRPRARAQVGQSAGGRLAVRVRRPLPARSASPARFSFDLFQGPAPTPHAPPLVALMSSLLPCLHPLPPAEAGRNLPPWNSPHTVSVLRRGTHQFLFFFFLPELSTCIPYIISESEKLPNDRSHTLSAFMATLHPALPVLMGGAETHPSDVLGCVSS